MKYVLGLAIVIAGIPLNYNTRAASYADAVVSYSPGTGFASGFDQANAALGEPSRVTPGPFGGPVDPFNPAYLSDQVVSIGVGGSLTLSFNSPIANAPGNSHGLDFIIFGNNGFQIVNGDFSGGGVTDGSLFGANTGETRVSVSTDGNQFYELTPSLAPVVDGPFPTDGTGNFSVPMNPALTRQSFAGKDLAGIRQLYAGSGGGSAYDISWARDAAGNPVSLNSIRYIQVQVLSGVAEVDGISVVPEPRCVILLLGGMGAMLFFRKGR